MEPKTILIVDDSESIRTALAFLVTMEGYTALTAFDGEEGVRMAQQHRPDVIILDIMMPVLDGWGAIRQIRTHTATADIPVLALTALRLSQEQLDEAGFDGYLSKPTAAHRLREEIGRACARVA